MSKSKMNLDSLRHDIGHLFLSERLAQTDYADLFYNHLTSLIKFKLLGQTNNLDELKLNEKAYLGLEQYTFEHTEIVENDAPGMIDWDLIDEAKEILKSKIQGLLKFEGNSDYLKPIVSFTVNSYENWLMYKQLYPNSQSNPWLPTNHILRNGYLFLVSDNRDLIEHYQKKVYNNVTNETNGNLGVIAKTKKKSFSGFLVDNRANIQGLVYEYLKREAFGVGNAKRSEKIADFLRSQKVNLSANEIRNKVTLPLKRSGMIGSLTTGFYFISNENDLIQTYIHHKEKLLGIQRTLNLYKEQGKRLGIEDIDTKLKQKDFFNFDE